MKLTSSFEVLATIIQNLPASAGVTTVVAVDGCGGSGKSTFAAALSKSLEDCPVIHTDDFASWDNPLEWWPRLLDQVLAPLARSEPARYQRYDWETQKLAEWHEVRSKMVILEGVSSTRREFRPYVAYRIWIECPPEIRLRRGLARDGASMEDQWRLWMAAEDGYVADQNPREVADLIVDGSYWGPEGSFNLVEGE